MVTGKHQPMSVGLDLRSYFHPRKANLWVAGGLVAVAIDYVLVWHFQLHFSWARFLPVGIALILFGEKARAKPGNGWPKGTPNGGWKLWGKVSLIVTAWALLLWFLMYGIASYVPRVPNFPPVDPADVPPMLFPMCILAPVIEEGVYRILLCTALATRFRHRTVVIISGTAFAGLHLLYGNLAPTNLLAGYLLSWAYLMSGSFWVPMVWHAVGNLGILSAGMALFLLQ